MEVVAEVTASGQSMQQLRKGCLGVVMAVDRLTDRP